jgi:hypothetical protein
MKQDIFLFYFYFIDKTSSSCDVTITNGFIIWIICKVVILERKIVNLKLNFLMKYGLFIRVLNARKSLNMEP